jgi:hypothetical protein
MNEVVTGVETDHVFDRLGSALLVNAYALKLLLAQTMKQSQICGSEDPELIEGLVE